MLTKANYFGMSRMRLRLLVLIAISIVAALVWVIAQPAQAEKFTNRGMYINSARASDSTYYIISFQYASAAAVGSVKMEFCTSPIPSLPCTPPPGLNVAGSSLAAQSGTTGFTKTSPADNIIVLSRTASSPGAGLSSYRFDNVINPDGSGYTDYPNEPIEERTNFYVRLTSHASNDGTGPLIDFGSVANTITPEIGLITQVPPVLIFCVAGVIHDDLCEDTEGYDVDFGEFNANETFYTSSEMIARTNAYYGYSISVYGNTMTSGIRSIPAITSPTQSLVGVGQFGINLVNNTYPDTGVDPSGPGINAVVNPQYELADQYLYNNGDVLVTSTGVTRLRKFTTSYIINVPEDQDPGVYSTTLTYICLAGF